MRWLAAIAIVALLVVDYLYYDEFGPPPQIEGFLESLRTGDSESTPTPEVEGFLGRFESGNEKATPTKIPTNETLTAGSTGCPSPPCAWDYEPVISNVSWEQRPTLRADGAFSFTAQIEEGHTLVLPSLTQRGVSNVALVTGSTLHGNVIPPAGPGYSWNATPGQYVAHTYDYTGSTLTVGANLSGSLYSVSRLETCLWSGGPVSQAYILDCIRIEKR